MASPESQLSHLLAHAAHEGGECAFDRVIEAAQQRFVQLTRRMLRNYPHLQRWEATDDVVQEAAVRLYRSLDETRPSTTAEFFGLAALQIRRTIIDLARHHFGPQGNARRHRSDPMLMLGHHFNPVDLSDEPQSLAEWTAFHEAVDRLPNDERTVFEAVFYGGMTYAETASLTGVTRRTVIRRMNCARLRLTRFVIDADVLTK